MAALIPEIVLFNLIGGMIRHVDSDFGQHQSDPENSFLGRVLMGTKDHKHDYFEEAKALFLRKNDNPRYLRTRLFFDAQEANIPTVHITMPQESSGEDSLGVGEYGHEDYIFRDGAGNITPGRENRFDTTYQIIITSDNHREVLIIYHVLRAMLVSALSEVNIAGLENPKLGGADIRTSEDIVPKSIFMRGISLQCSYEVLVPRFFDSQEITNLIINPGTIVSP